MDDGDLAWSRAIFMGLELRSSLLRHLHRFGVAEPKIVFPFSGATLHKRLAGFGFCPYYIHFSSRAMRSGQEAGYVPAREQMLVIDWVVKPGREPGLQKWLCIDRKGRFIPCLDLHHDERATEK